MRFLRAYLLGASVGAALFLGPALPAARADGTTTPGAPVAATVAGPAVPGVVDPHSGGIPFTDVAPITPGAGGGFVSNTLRRVIISLGAGVLFDPGSKIDEIVGDPWTLNPSTAAKLERLPSKFRLQMYSALAAHPESMSGISPVGLAPTNTPAAAGSATPPVVTLNSGLARQFVNELGNRMGNYFSVEEMIDLGVYYLSRQPFFPKTKEGWEQVKGEIVKNGALIAAGVLLTEAATNQGALSVDGKLIKLPGDGWQIGWYASIRDFGVSLRPTIREGVNLHAPHVEASAGLVEPVNSGPQSEKLGAEFYFREHFLSALVAGSGWDAGIYSNTHVTLVSGDPSQVGHVQSDFNFYARTDHFARDPSLAFMATASYSTDYRGRSAGSANIGLEQPRWDLAGGISATRIADINDPAHSGVQVGFFIGGSLESSLDLARGRMQSASGFCQDRLDSLAREKQRLLDIEEKLKRFGTGAYTPAAENELIQNLLAQERAVGAAKEELRRVFTEYLEYRTRYYVLSGHESRDTITDDDGPLGADRMAQIRIQLGDDPRYRSFAAVTAGGTNNGIGAGGGPTGEQVGASHDAVITSDGRWRLFRHPASDVAAAPAAQPAAPPAGAATP